MIPKNDCNKIIGNAVLAFTVPIYDLDLPTARACLEIVRGYTAHTNCPLSNYKMKDALIYFLEDRIMFLEANISNQLTPTTL